MTDPARSIRCVTLSTFRIGRYEVTNAEFAEFVANTGHVTDAEILGDSFVSWYGGTMPGANWKQPGGTETGIQGLDRHPLVHVSWRDAQAYVDWLSAWSGKPYRLLTEAEREMAARGPGFLRWGCGDEADPARANIDASGRDAPCAVGSYPPAGYGACDMDGNVCERVSD